MLAQSAGSGSTTPAWVPVAIAAVGVAGTALGALMNWALSSTTGRRSEVRELRLHLIDARDLAWETWPAFDRYTAKLRTRLHTLGMPRNCIDALRQAGLEATRSVTTAGASGGTAGGLLEPDEKLIDSEALAAVDTALEELDLRLARMGRLIRPPRWRR